jgi:hypothetical protein
MAVDERIARLWLLGLCVLSAGVFMVGHASSLLPPHSAHDGFLLVPQLQHLLGGSIPDDGFFGMFNPTWFSPHAIPTAELGWSGFWERVLGNVQSHSWIDAPHPLALMALLGHWLPLGTWGPVVVQAALFSLLMVSLYCIGTKAQSPRAGLLAATLAMGAPGLFGTVQYIEPHLAVAAVSTCAVALLLHTDGLRRWWVAVAASVVLWSLSRSGEGSGEAVIAGLVVVGPGLMAVAGSDRTQTPIRWVVGLCALVIPFMLLADLDWIVVAMEQVTRAFEDPSVQTDVVAKGGVLGSRFTWVSAYGVLTFTDYLRPALSLVVVAGLVAAWRTRPTHRWSLLLWLLVPWIALSWMQRKASWYGVPLLPPLVLWAALGLDRLELSRWRRVAVSVAVGQFLLFSLLPAHAFPVGLSWLREPLAVHDWRLRRIDFLRPMDDVATRKVQSDLESLVEWMETNENPGPVAVMTMGTRHDFAARYFLAMSLPGVEVVNLGDPRVRAARYRSLHPSDFGVFVFVDDGAREWPPSESQADWLRGDLRCVEDDPFDSFMAAVFERASEPVDGFYPLSGDVSPVLGPGQIWRGEPGMDGLCAP